MSNQIPSMPSYNPADAQSATGLYKFLIKRILRKIEKVTPAQIVDYDRATNRAKVQILANEITSTGEKLPRLPIPNIPILMLSGGGFVLSFPVKKDDIGWLVAADRDISVFKKLLGLFTPNTYRKHKYEDSFFIPDKVNGFEISEDDKDAVLLTSIDGMTKFSIKPGQVTITAPQTLINGALQVNGPISATDTIISNVDVIAGGISGKSHAHGGVEPGSGTTGAPQ